MEEFSASENASTGLEKLELRAVLLIHMSVPLRIFIGQK